MGELRATKQFKVTIASGASESDAFDMSGFGAGGVVMPAAWTAADLGIKVCGSAGGTFVPLKDIQNAYGTDVSIDGPVAAAAYRLPWDCFAFPYVKLWSHNGSGTATNQAAARTLTVFLKA